MQTAGVHVELIDRMPETPVSVAVMVTPTGGTLVHTAGLTTIEGTLGAVRSMRMVVGGAVVKVLWALSVALAVKDFVPVSRPGSCRGVAVPVVVEGGAATVPSRSSHSCDPRRGDA